MNVRHWPIYVLLLVSVVVSWPLLARPFTADLGDTDSRFIIFTMTWVARALTQRPAELFNAPLYHPLEGTLTFSDPLLTGALIGLPFWLVTQQPVIFQTVNVVLALGLTSAGVYALVYALIRQKTVALAAAALFTFSFMLWEFRFVLHTLMFAGVPWGLYAWHQFSRQRANRWLILWLVSFLYQIGNSPQTAVFFVACHGLFIFDAPSWIVIRSKRRAITVTVAIALTAAAALYLPYFLAARAYQGERSIREAAHFSASLNELVNRDGPIRFGLIISALVISGAVIRRQTFSPLVKGAVLSGLTCLIFALGPVLKWHGQTVKIVGQPIPLPYSVAYYALPGFKAFRAISRWILPGSLLLLIAAVILSHRQPRLWLTAALLILVLEKPWQYPVIARPSPANRPNVFDWLEKHGSKTALFLPTYLYDSPVVGAKPEVERMLWSIGGVGEPIRLMNGYSGFAPDDHVRFLLDITTASPSGATVGYLEAAQTNVLVIDRSQSPNPPDWLAGTAASYQDERFTVYPTDVE